MAVIIPKLVKVKGEDFYVLPSSQVNAIVTSILTYDGHKDRKLVEDTITAIIKRINSLRPIFLSSGKLYNPKAEKVTSDMGRIPVNEYPLHYLIHPKELAWIKAVLKKMDSVI